MKIREIVTKMCRNSRKFREVFMKIKEKMQLYSVAISACIVERSKEVFLREIIVLYGYNYQRTPQWQLASC